MDSTHETLTKREADVLVCLAEVDSLREVAARLHIAYGTVKWYTRQIYGKLDVNSRDEAIAKAWAVGLLNGTNRVKHNLPAQTTAFVGRERELAQLAALLADPHSRLITILAPGGMGKTRLGLESTQQFLTPHITNGAGPRFADGIFFVPLAPLESAEFILSAIGDALGFIFHEGPDPTQQLLDHIRDKHLLLVMDNFEHVLDGATLLTDLLQAAPGVTILVTSRERLNLNAETIYTLGRMTLPDGDKLEDVLQYDTVQLFVQSARRLRPGFDPAWDDLHEITRICRLTDGMPLAIILAAAWLDALSLTEIADEITHNLDLLQTTMRDVPERLHSIRAVFESVWNQMTDAERGVFLRLSVFRGGWTRDAAEAVAGARPRAMQGLVNKALLVHMDSGRYEMHELLRQYAEERLTKTPDVYHYVRDHHSVYYGELIAQWEWWTHTAAGYQGMRATGETEWDNLQAAWLWAGQRGQHTVAWQLMWPVACISYHRGTFQEAAWSHAEVIDSLQRRETGDKDDLLLAALLASHAFLSTFLGQSEQVAASAHQSLDCLHKVKGHTDQPEVAKILNVLAMDLRDASPALASELAETCITLCRATGDMSHLVWAFFEWVIVEFAVLGNDTQARPVIEEALDLARQQEVANMVMQFTHLLGAVHYQEGDLIEAKRMALEARSIAQSIDDRLNSVTPLVLLGDIALKEDDHQTARDYYYEALSGFNQVSRKPRFTLSLLAGIAALHVAEEKWEQAAEMSAFVAHHPFRHAYWSPQERVGNLLKTLESKLPGDAFASAVAHGKALDMDTVFSMRLGEFDRHKVQSANTA